MALTLYIALAEKQAQEIEKLDNGDETLGAFRKEVGLKARSKSGASLDVYSIHTDDSNLGRFTGNFNKVFLRFKDTYLQVPDTTFTNTLNLLAQPTQLNLFFAVGPKMANKLNVIFEKNMKTEGDYPPLADTPALKKIRITFKDIDKISADEEQKLKIFYSNMNTWVPNPENITSQYGPDFYTLYVFAKSVHEAATKRDAAAAEQKATRESATAEFNRGKELLTQPDQTDAALEVFAGLNNQYPNTPSFIFYLGECHLKLGHHTEALKYFEESLTKMKANDDHRDSTAAKIKEVKQTIKNARSDAIQNPLFVIDDVPLPKLINIEQDPEAAPFKINFKQEVMLQATIPYTTCTADKTCRLKISALLTKYPDQPPVTTYIDVNNGIPDAGGTSATYTFPLSIPLRDERFYTIFMEFEEVPRSKMRVLGTLFVRKKDKAVETIIPAASNNRPAAQAPTPAAQAPTPAAQAPTQVAPAPTQVAPAPTQVAPAPTQVAPAPTQVAPAPTQVDEDLDTLLNAVKTVTVEGSLYNPMSGQIGTTMLISKDSPAFLKLKRITGFECSENKPCTLLVTPSNRSSTLEPQRIPYPRPSNEKFVTLDFTWPGTGIAMDLNIEVEGVAGSKRVIGTVNIAR